MITLAAATGIIVFLTGAWFVWQVFGPSVITIRNIGDQPVRLVLTDAEHSIRVWSGDVGPGRRRTVMVWFKGEGSPELRCRDRTSSSAAPLSYVTGYMPINAEVEITGCDHVGTSFSW